MWWWIIGIGLLILFWNNIKAMFMTVPQAGTYGTAQAAAPSWLSRLFGSTTTAASVNSTP